jgi:short-subunit dehydrogenase
MSKGARVVAITGASSGVGRATAREFARTGATVGLLARGEEGLEACAEEVRSLGGRPVVLRTDVAEADQVEGAAELLEREHGPIEVWVNNAMATVFGEVQAITAEEYRRVTEVTYLGVVYGTLSALRAMLPRDRGVIVQVGSALAYRGIPLQSAYCAAKHAIQGFTESLRGELLHQASGVHVTMVQLPALNTPQFEVVRARVSRHPRPVAPVYQPELAARAILAAAEHPARASGGSAGRRRSV